MERKTDKDTDPQGTPVVEAAGSPGAGSVTSGTSAHTMTSCSSMHTVTSCSSVHILCSGHPSEMQPGCAACGLLLLLRSCAAPRTATWEISD